MCISNGVLEEYLEVLARNINSRVAESIIYTILASENVMKLDPHYHFHLIKVDEDDNKFVDCAIVANAKYIVTEDRHFDALKRIPFPVVAVIGIDDFVEELKSFDSRYS